jgi:hypothetical protein
LRISPLFLGIFEYHGSDSTVAAQKCRLTNQLFLDTLFSLYPQVSYGRKTDAGISIDPQRPIFEADRRVTAANGVYDNG